MYDAGNDSITGLVDSMLLEASIEDPDPQTPESQNRSLHPANDVNLTIGGDEDGVPHERVHHAEHLRMQRQEIFNGDRSGSFEEAEEYDTNISFSSIIRSTPPKAAHVLSLDSGGTSTLRTPTMTTLPYDIERAEDDMPLGRTHHADRSRLAHMQASDPIVDREVQLLPPSPSPGRRVEPRSSEEGLSGSMVPKFDLGLGSASPKVELNNVGQHCKKIMIGCRLFGILTRLNY